jgi:site-specific recombinase XerD
MHQLSLKLEPVNRNTNFNNLPVGPMSYFKDDVWDLSLFMPQKSKRPCQKRLQFNYIHTGEMKFTAKLYAYHMLGKVKPDTVRGRITGNLPTFIKYSKANRITSFADITADVFLDYVRYLKNDYQITTGMNKGKKIAPQTGYYKCYLIEQIIKTGQIAGWWNVPKQEIFTHFKPNDFWDFISEKNDRRFSPYPVETLDRILNAAINCEQDVMTRCGITILSQTGLRISEMLSIQKGCIKKYHGNNFLEISRYKLERGEPQKDKIICNDMVVQAVKDLTKSTKALQEQSGLKELFLNRSAKLNGKIGVVSRECWNIMLKRFATNHNIRGRDGGLCRIHSHRFRSTWATNAVMQGKSTYEIMKHLGHETIAMTAHYIHLHSKFIREQYAEILISKESKLAGPRATEIHQNIKNQIKGKTAEEIGEIIVSLADSTYFQPLPMGICLFDERRGNCANGDGCFVYNCRNFITDVKFLPILKKEAENYQKALTRAKMLNNPLEIERITSEYKFLEPHIKKLENQL